MRVLAGILAVFCCLAVAGVAIAWHSINGIDVPSDGATSRPGPVNARTIFASLDRNVAGDEHRPGVAYRCRAAGTRRYRCLVPGRGAGDLRYRVRVDDHACWTARRAGASPRHGCAWVTAPAAD